MTCGFREVLDVHYDFRTVIRSTISGFDYDAAGVDWLRRA